MTALGIFGNCDASQKLVTASLNDLLEAHVTDTPTAEFRLYIGIPKTLPVYLTILDWAARNQIPVDIYLPFPPKVLQANYGERLAIAAWHRSDRYMLELVNTLEYHADSKIYALLGDEEPPVDVRRALVRAIDNGLEVRDLAEAGLTYVGVADNPLRQGSTTMADDMLTLEAAGKAADEDGDEEAIQALTDFATEHGLDPDDYPTWAELAAVLDPLMAEDSTTEEPAPASGTLTAEELEDKSVPELRNLAKQLGVEGWETNRSAKLISGILAAQNGGSTVEPDDSDSSDAIEAFDDVPMLGSSNGITAAALARGLRAFADALEG